MAGAALAIAAALSTSIAYMETRRLTATETSGAIAVYFTLFCVLASLGTLHRGWIFPSPSDFALLMAVGILGGIAQIIFTLAMARAAASLLAPFEYLSLLWALGLGVLLFDEWPTSVMQIGASLITLSALAAARTR